MFACLKSLNLFENYIPPDHYKILDDFLKINWDRVQKYNLVLLKIEKDKITSEK